MIFLRLSKPPFEIEEGEEEEIEATVEQKLVETARTLQEKEKEKARLEKEKEKAQKLKKCQNSQRIHTWKLNASAKNTIWDTHSLLFLFWYVFLFFIFLFTFSVELVGVTCAHPFISPPPSNEAWEGIPPFLPPSGYGNQFVRPLGHTPESLSMMAVKSPTTAKVMRPADLTLPPSTRRNTMVRSISAPDVRLAPRALKKSKAKAAAAKTKVHVALFQPHGMGVGARRDLLHGTVARLRNNTRRDGERVGSISPSTSGASKAARYQQMVDLHSKALEQKRVEQLRERARLFGLKVATAKAQLRASRAKAKYIQQAALAATAASTASMAAADRRNNQSRRESAGPSSRAQISEEDSKATSMSASSGTMAQSSSSYSSSSSAPSTNAQAVRTAHWGMSNDSSGDQPPTYATAMLLPQAGTQAETDLIQKLAIQSLDREVRQQQQQSQYESGDDRKDMTPGDSINLSFAMLPTSSSTNAESLHLMLPVSPSHQNPSDSAVGMLVRQNVTDVGTPDDESKQIKH